MSALHSQRDVMRRLYRETGGHDENTVAAYAEAERAGEVERKSDVHATSGEDYARALLRDGLRKGWLLDDLPAPRSPIPSTCGDPVGVYLFGNILLAGGCLFVGAVVVLAMVAAWLIGWEGLLALALALIPWRRRRRSARDTAEDPVVVKPSSG